MNEPCANEVEERRVIRLLTDAADDVVPLPRREVDELLHAAAGGRPRLIRRRPLARPLQRMLAAGAAAAVVVSGSLASTASQPHGAATDPGSTDARPVPFPEGSALRLLLFIHSNGGRT